MTVIAPSHQPDSHDAESTVEPDRGGEALIDAATQHRRRRRRPERRDADRADVEALIREARRRARRRRATIGVVAVVAFASLAWVTALSLGSAQPTGGTGPELESAQAGVVPAKPAPSATLVASFYTHWSAGGGDAWVYVYDDGRVVSAGPWDVRRLTPDGVALLRAEIIDSGILDPGRYSEAPEFGPGAFVQLRVDGVLTTAWQPSGPADAAEVAAFDRVVVQLRDFDDWLPADAWAQPEAEAYVPPGYAVCTSSGNESAHSVHDALLPLLPEAASAIVADSPRFGAIDARIDAFAGSSSSPSSDIVGCRHVTPAQAQSVVDALVRARWGVEDSGPPREGEQVVLAERERIDPFDMWAEAPGAGRVHVAFLPILPHGVPECACVG